MMKKKLLSVLLSAAILSTSALSMFVGVSAAEAEADAAPAAEAQRLDGEGFDLLESNESYDPNDIMTAFYNDGGFEAFGPYTAGDANDLQFAPDGSKAKYEIDTSTSACRPTDDTTGSYQSMKITPYNSGAGQGFFRWGGVTGTFSADHYLDDLDVKLKEGKYDDVNLKLIFWAKSEVEGSRLNVSLDVKNTAFSKAVNLTTEWAKYELDAKEMLGGEDSAYPQCRNQNFMQAVIDVENGKEGCKWGTGLNESYLSRIRFQVTSEMQGHAFWLDEIGFEYSGFEIAPEQKAITVEDTDVPYPPHDLPTYKNEEPPVTSSDVTSSEETSSEETSSVTSSEEETSSEGTSSVVAVDNDEIQKFIDQDIYSIAGDKWILDNFNNYTTDSLYNAYFDWFYNKGKNKDIYGGVQAPNSRVDFETDTGAKSMLTTVSNVNSTIENGALKLSWSKTTPDANWSWLNKTYFYPTIRFRPNNAFKDGAILPGDGFAIDINSTVDMGRVTLKLSIDLLSNVYQYETSVSKGTTVLKVPYTSLQSTGTPVDLSKIEKQLSRGEALVLGLAFCEGEGADRDGKNLPSSGSATFDNARFYTDNTAYTAAVTNAKSAATVDTTGMDAEQVALYNAAMQKVNAEYAALGGAGTPKQYSLIANKYAYAAKFVGVEVKVDDVVAADSNNNSTSPKTGDSAPIALAALFMIGAGCTAILLGKKRKVR